MIFYHGLPITPESAGLMAIRAGHAFVSHAWPAQLGLAASVAQSFALDNGAFSAWKSGNPIGDFSPFYKWVADASRLPGFDFAVIPDAVDGTEAENDRLVAEWPWLDRPWVGAPVWHLHESLDRLGALIERFPRVCLGSSGDLSNPGGDGWWDRISEAMDIACDEGGMPKTKLHGLRMMDSDLIARIPFASVDSTNIARNVNIDRNWTGSYQPRTKEARASLMRHRIESFDFAVQWAGHSRQERLFGNETILELVKP